MKTLKGFDYLKFEVKENKNSKKLTREFEGNNSNISVLERSSPGDYFLFQKINGVIELISFLLQEACLVKLLKAMIWA